MIPLVGSTERSPVHRDKEQKGGYQGGNGELLFNVYRASVWGDDKVVEMDGGDGCTTMRTYLLTPMNG